jgi:uncharacterized DUF497 family protein
VSYEWDPAKARQNLRKHGVDFGDAVTVLEDEAALTIRDPFSEQEQALDHARHGRLGAFAGGRVQPARRSYSADLCAPGDTA